MSVWGKIIGGAAGFALGGYLGAVLGAAAGHSYDRMKREKTEGGGPFASGAFSGGGAGGAAEAGPEDLQVTFATCVIVLGAKLAKADGRVTPDEVQAFKRVFDIPPEDMAAVGRIFDEAKQDAEGFEPYARQAAALFQGRPAVLEELMTALFRIALADGVYHGAERGHLMRTARIFGLSEAGFARLEAVFTQGADAEDPYAVLGLSPDAGDAEVKAKYRSLIREHHPDRLTAQGMPEEFIAQANEKTAAVNAAYDKIEKQRGLK